MNDYKVPQWMREEYERNERRARWGEHPANADLLIPDEWVHATAGTVVGWRRRHGDGERMMVAHGQETTVLPEWHVGWIGTDLVRRRPDGSDEERIAVEEWATLDELREPWGLAEDATLALLRANPELADKPEELRAAAEAVRIAEAQRKEDERAARRLAADRARPRHRWEGLDLVVRVEDEVKLRLRDEDWNYGKDPVNVLGRRLNDAEFPLDRETRVAMINARRTPSDTISEVLGAVRAAQADLEAGLERARRAYSSQTSTA